jgi:hypothetical protein
MNQLGAEHMQVSPASPGVTTSSAMEGGEALAAGLAKSVQKLEGEAAMKLLASTAQVQAVPSNPVGSTGSVIGQHINISV